MITGSSLPADVSDLHDRLDGHLVSPGDDTWDAARQAWNLAVDQHPALVAIPRSAADVQAIVHLAREHGLRIAMQGTGHNAAPLGPLDGTILVKTHEMRGVDIDAARGVARVGAGALWLDVTAAASELGFAPLAGSSPDVGVVGYTLGGGLSWLGRRYGLAAERVLAIELVTADGRLVRATRTEEPELFWALRGGGGSFGAVTAMEFELLPVERVYAGMLLFDASRAADVAHAWRTWTTTAPDTATTALRILHMPPIPELPDFLRGRSVVVVDGAILEDDAAAAEVLAPLRALGPEVDTFASIAPVGLSHIHMDPDHPVPGLSTSALLADFPAEAVETMIELAGPQSGTPLMFLEIRHLGGALARPGTGALGRLDGEYLMMALGAPMNPMMVPALEAALALTASAFEPHAAGRAYGNFAETATDVETLFGAATAARLRRVKADVDADDVFAGNHHVAPAE